ncbi:AAWKG family protein, partial [Streptomyces sp. NPDC098781]|uniref:AAWKG family protein n=1 Tax=Streptomyces sp. NPDC098781 TaxID=3366097 RepID=UPI003811C019
MVYPADSTDDYWAQAVELFTGYPIPPRAGVFEQLRGNDEIPLMEVKIEDFGKDTPPAEDLYHIVDNLYWRTENSGSSIGVKSFVIPFYAPENGSMERRPGPGTEVVLKKALITLLGSSYTAEPPHGGTVVGGKFGSYDDVALSQYSYGGGLALQRLLTERNTVGFEWAGLIVPNSAAVDVESFDRTARAFNRAAIFLDMQKLVLERWENRLGKEHSEWRGRAAGVFADLIHRLKKMYQDYSEGMPHIGFADSTVKRQLDEAARAFLAEIDMLVGRWDFWQFWQGNPLRWLHDHLLELTKYIWDNNITATGIEYEEAPRMGYGRYPQFRTSPPTPHRRVQTPNFDVGHDAYGHLADMATWRKIGEAAIRAWQDSVRSNLGDAAQNALMATRKIFSIDIKPISTISGPSLNQKLQSDLNEIEKEKVDKKNEEAERKNREREKKDEEYRKHLEEQRKEDQGNQKKLQDIADERYEKEMKHQAEMEDETRKKQAEAEKKEEAYRQQLEEQRKEEMEKQEEQRKEAQKEADEREKRAREDADKREQEQREYNSQVMVQQKLEQEKDRKRQEAKQEELERKQEGRQRELERKQEEQQEKEEKRQQELERKQEEQEKKEQERQLVLERKQELRQRELERKQEEQQEKEEKRRQELEHRQEEQQEKEEKRRRELERKQEEQQEKEEKRRQELEHRQEEQQEKA